MGSAPPARPLPRLPPGVGSRQASQKEPHPSASSWSTEEVLEGRPHAIALSTTRGQVLVVLFFQFGEKVYKQNSTRVLP